MTDDELSRLAEEALLREAQRGAMRAQISGPSGWLKCRQPSTNKTFLRNTLLGAMASNRAKERQEKSQSERGQLKRQREEKERNKYKRVYLHASTKRKNPPETCVEEEKEKKQADSKSKSSTGPVFLWTDSGLQLNPNKKDSKCKKNSDREKKKVSDSSVLSRKIKFVSGKEESRDKR